MWQIFTLRLHLNRLFWSKSNLTQKIVVLAFFDGTFSGNAWSGSICLSIVSLPEYK